MILEQLIQAFTIIPTRAKYGKVFKVIVFTKGYLSVTGKEE